MCTMCPYLFCEMCLDLFHHDSTREYYLKEYYTHGIVIFGHCLYSFKRIYKFIDEEIVNDELISETCKCIF